MTDPETTQSAPEEFSFSEFSKLAFYREANSRLVDISEVYKQEKIIDLGCGTGAITKLILDRMQAARESMQAAKDGLQGRVQAAKTELHGRVQAAKDGINGKMLAARENVIYAVDHSSTALKLAMAELGTRREAAIKFVQAEVQQLHTAVRDQVDAVIYCNSIHYVPDKASLLTQIRAKLRPGGTLAINTSFFSGPRTPETDQFLSRWMMRSLRILKREYGMMPDKAKKVESRKQLSADEYEALLTANGFEVVRKDTTEFKVPIEGWHHISGFSDWIEGTMPGVPLEIGRAALQKGLREVFDEMRLTAVPRTWLSISAVRAA